MIGGEIMAVSKAQQKAVNKYMKENYDRINLTVPKGHKAAIQARADQTGESVNGYINRLIDADMLREKSSDRSSDVASLEGDRE